MPSAKIYRFPRPFRHRSVPSAPLRYATRPYSRPDAGGFGLLLIVTLLVAFLYLTGAVSVARHDALYAALLAAVWSLYFIHDKLLRTRLGLLLRRAGRLLLLAAVASFFGGIYWLILTSG
jgi:hypothetical protein